MKLESVARFYEKALVAGAALLPAVGISYLLTLSTPSTLFFEKHGFGESSLTVLALIGSLVFYGAWRSYRALREVFARQETLRRMLEEQQALTESANRELQASQTRLNTVLNGVQDGVITIGKSGKVRSFNHSAEKIFGYGSDEVVGQNINRLMPQPDRSEHDAYLSRYAETGAGQVVGRIREVTGLRKDGSSFPMELWVNEALVNGEVLFVGSVRDIALHKQASEQLRVAAVTFEAQQGILITDANFRILRANKALLAETGFSESDLVGRTPKMLDAGVHDASFYKLMWETLVQSGSWQGEITGLRKGGAVYPKWLAISTVRNESGAVSHYVSTHSDITERKRMEQEVSELAFYDPLTKLANRRLLTDRLRQALSGSKRGGHYGALIFLDLDNFKPLNDRYGHEVGDMLLKEAAQRLKGCVREVDTVARFGGDEFVVVLSALHAEHGNSVAQAELIAGKIRSSLSEPYRLTVRCAQEAETTVEHHCTASIGVTLLARTDVSPDDVLRRADRAMYDAKREGRNQTRFCREAASVADAQAPSKMAEPCIAGHSHLHPHASARPRSQNHAPRRESISVT